MIDGDFDGGLQKKKNKQISANSAQDIGTKERATLKIETDRFWD